jgi:hypothetical protein
MSRKYNKRTVRISANLLFVVLPDISGRTSPILTLDQ